VDLAPGEEMTLAALVAAGRVAEAPDTSRERTTLERLRAELASLAKQSGSPAKKAIRDKELRGQILGLVETVSRSEGAAIVRAAGGGPYRGSSGHAAYVVTFQARSLLSDLAPRLGRVGRMPLEDFRAHMQALRAVFLHRARRTHSLLGLMRAQKPTGASDGAVRAAAVGLAARNEPEREVAATWALLARGLIDADARDGTMRNEWTPDQEVAAAEGMILATANLGTLSIASAAHAHQTRLQLLKAHSAGQAEDALDATMLIAGMPEVIAKAQQIAHSARAFGAPLTLTGALVVRASRAVERAELFVQIHRELVRASEGSNDAERTAAAALLTLGGKDATTLVQRARDLRAYLSRFSPEGMLVPAVLLSLLPTDLAETLDLVRMVSSELQREKLGAGGGESLALAIKLLLSTALLAQGAHGDPEEQAGFLRFEQLELAQLGMAGLASQLPLTLAALTAFHRPALDAAVYYQEIHQPTHSAYVFGSGRGGSWG
jgi:hypothetical protein